MGIRFITDSASDLDRARHPEVGVVPLHIIFGEESFLDGETITHEGFYERLIETDCHPQTGQVTPYAFEQAFREALSAGDDVIAVLLSHKLSGTFESAVQAAAQLEEEGASAEGHRLHLVDCGNASVGEAALLEHGIRLAGQGLSAEEIVRELEAAKGRIRLVALLDTLEYLKRGGRISGAAAAMGELLSIKPVIAIADGEVSVVGRARGSRNGNNLLVKCIGEAGGIDYGMPILLGYTGLSDKLLRKYVADSAALWEGKVEELPCASVGATIGTHVGPNGIVVAFFAQEG